MFHGRFQQSRTVDFMPSPIDETNAIFPEQWHGRPATELPTVPNSSEETVQLIEKDDKSSEINGTLPSDPQLPALPARPPLVPERSDFFDRGWAERAPIGSAWVGSAQEVDHRRRIGIRSQPPGHCRGVQLELAWEFARPNDLSIRKAGGAGADDPRRDLSC